MKDHIVLRKETEEDKMSQPRKKGRIAMTVAIYVLLVTWILLLLLLIWIYMLRLQGYDNFTEWKNKNQVQEVMKPSVITVPAALTPTQVPEEEPTEAPKLTIAATATPEPTMTPVPTQVSEEEPTEAPESMVAATATPVPIVTVVPTVTLPPTATPTPTTAPIPEQQNTVYSGREKVDEKIRTAVAGMFADGEEECYVDYHTGIFYSIVFQQGERLLPLVFDLTTEEQVLGSDLIKETYFAITKERLQSYVKERFPEAAESGFVTYEQTYEAEDYQSFYLTEEQLVFYFEENVLAEHQKAFSYSVPLSEAKAFLYKDMEGNRMQPVIRDLDPNAKMIALTWDDGPHEKVENKILDFMEEQEIRATFFFLGQRTNDWYPHMPGKAYKAGHEVGSHTYSHTLDFGRVTAEEMWSEVNRTNLLIAASTGYAPDYIRFPGGTDGKRTTQIPMVVVNWSMDSIDYREKNKENGAQIIYDRLKESKYLEDGAIILIHSIYENSYEAMVKLIPYLKEQGYVFVTLSELFYYKGFTPDTGIAYYTGFGATELEER